MEEKEKARELVDRFLPHAYCYLGSGMSSNTYDEKVARENTKQCALKCVDEKIITAQKIAAVLTAASSVAQFEPDVPGAIRIWCKQIIDELQSVKTEIENL